MPEPHLLCRHNDGLNTGRLLCVRLLDWGVKDESLDARFGDDADADHSAGAAIVVHGVQNSWKFDSFF